MTAPEQTLLDNLRAACAKGPISYAEYIQYALYAEGCGYYTKERDRVGRNPNRDFYTAESLGSVFAQLVVTAAEDLLPEGIAAQSTFVEIAAEPGTELLSHLEGHPFKDSHVIRQGDAVAADGPVVIFANEWLDALPFHRLIFKDGSWRERGVDLDENGGLIDILLPKLSPSMALASSRLPEFIEDGYEIDLSLAAEDALRELCQQNWTGLILLFDYGKTWTSLCTDCPSGTARTYYKHTQENDLLALPGQKDITCDVCWDPLSEVLKNTEFAPITLESQESFIVKRAQRAAEAIVTQSAGDFSQSRQTLMELIHPANMGQRFQVLWGIRKG
ncbi:MAG: SAM-dependent methyltransferase [Lentimonas sp.]